MSNQFVFKSKKDFFSIPYWDRKKIESIDFDTFEFEHLRAHSIDRTHYVLAQVMDTGSQYLYQLLYVTVIGYVDRDHFAYKLYRPLVEVYFDHIEHSNFESEGGYLRDFNRDL